MLTYRIKYKYYNCYLECKNFKSKLVECKYLCSNKNYQHKLDKKLKERFSNTYKSCNNNNKKFILLLRQGVYPYKYTNH